MCRYGDIFLADLGDNEGSLQLGIRPVLVVSNDKANQYSSVITVIPMTSRRKRREMPTHVFITDSGLPRPSIVLTEQLTSINQSELIRKLGELNPEFREAIKRSIEIQLNL